MPNYSFSLTDEKTSSTIRSVDERLLSDVQRYSRRGLTQTAVTRKLESKGWATHAIERAWEHLRTTPTKPRLEPKWALRIFRFGFAGVFLINALVAWLQPQDFLGLMQKSLALNWLEGLEWLIPVIAINDLLIAVVILAAPKRYRPYVYAWVGLWFLAITVIKLTALNVFIS
jgi:hypothetical protein